MRDGHHHRPPAGGPVVLDIGGDVGALVATMDPEAEGSELFLRSDQDPPISVHTGVWRRSHDAGVSTVAVFPELVAGRYWVLAPDGSDVCPLEVCGGEVAMIDLRAPVNES
jgi:hypothetical protein